MRKLRVYQTSKVKQPQDKTKRYRNIPAWKTLVLQSPLITSHQEF